MDDAIKKVRQLAASALARKEKLEAELAELEAEKRRRESDRELAIASDDDALALELTTLIDDLAARVDLKRGEVETADAAYQEIVADLRAVQDAAKEHERLAERAPVDAVLHADPLTPSAEDAALENVRQHIEMLAAQAELNDELAGTRRAEQELERKIAALDAKEADARARAQLAELKAKRKQAQEVPAQEGETPPTSPKKPKKTM